MKDFFRFDSQDAVDEILTENYDNEMAIEQDSHIEETPIVEHEPVFEPAPVVEEVAPVIHDNSSVMIYAISDFTIKGVPSVKRGYNTLSKTDYEKIKHIKSVRLARPDEVARRQK